MQEEAMQEEAMQEDAMQEGAMQDNVQQKGTQHLTRCGWVDLSKPDYIQYHDHEWGVPVHDDSRLFEFLLLEGAQAGLSWYTVLKKRSVYQQVFAGFDAQVIAEFDAQHIETLLKNPGIIRNRLKVLSAVNNARKFLEVQAEFGSFDRYIWQFIGGKPRLNHWATLADCPSITPESDAMSRDLKKRGFTFVGSTICYAFMQATGMVNDHTLDCYVRQPQ